MTGHTQNKRKTILVILKYYLPGYKAGGPIQSVSNLVEWCGDTFDFKIITGDRDSEENKPFDNIKLNDWNTVGKAQVYYLKKENITFSYLRRLIKNTEYDFIYFNSFFRVQFSVIPLLLLKFVLRVDLSKVLLAPRGEFSQGALQIKSSKKRAFIWFVKQLGIYNKINWQATDETEIKNIKKTMGVREEKIFLAPNLPQKNSANQLNTFSKKENSLRIVYLSRVTPKKNLLFALNVIQQVQKINIEFDIYGFRDDAPYWERCRDAIELMGNNISVSYKGVIPHYEVLQTLAGYDLFFLPTTGENYGHAIYESFLASTPVLISDQTPWQDLVDKGLGWDIPLTNNTGFVEIVRKMGALNAQAMKKMKEGVKQAINKMDISEDVEQNKRVFHTLMH